MNKKQFIPIAIAAFAACSLALAEGEKQVFRFGGIFAGPTGSVEEQGQFSEPVGDGTIFSFDGTARTDTDSAFGIAVDYEYRWSDMLGISLSASSVRHDVEFHLGGDFWITDEFTGDLISSGRIDETEVVGDVTVNPLSVGINFHVYNEGKTDLYTGAFLAYVLFGDLDVEGEITSFQNDFTYGVQIGVDVPFKDTPWSFSAKLQYLDATAELDSSEGGGEFLSIRPVSLQFGMAYRF